MTSQYEVTSYNPIASLRRDGEVSVNLSLVALLSWHSSSCRCVGPVERAELSTVAIARLLTDCRLYHTSTVLLTMRGEATLSWEK